MERIISSHNQKILKEKRNGEQQTQTCNCKSGVDTCPIEGKCQVGALVYKATTKSTDNETKTYIGCTNNSFKERYTRHKASFKHSKQRKNTKLADYVWEKRDKGEEITSIKWEILKECNEYVGGDKCDVCLTEKLFIMKDKDPNSLNKRSELMNKCLHMRSWLLAKVKDG